MNIVTILVIWHGMAVIVASAFGFVARSGK